jgi:hypothetical protein
MAKNPLKYASVEALIFDELQDLYRPGYKVKFLANTRVTRVDIRKSMSCADTVAEGFWPPCVEHRHGGLRNSFFPAA